MSFSNLTEITKGMRLANPDQIVAQGGAAFRALFARSANPFNSDRDRALWDRGYREAEEKFNQMQRRWREADKGAR